MVGSTYLGNIYVGDSIQKSSQVFMLRNPPPLAEHHQGKHFLQTSHNFINRRAWMLTTSVRVGERLNEECM